MRFGQRAFSQTVCSRSSLSTLFVKKFALLRGMGRRSHVGSRRAGGRLDGSSGTTTSAVASGASCIGVITVRRGQQRMASEQVVSFDAESFNKLAHQAFAHL